MSSFLPSASVSPTSKSQRTPLVRLKFPGGRLSSSLRAHNGITADDAHLFLDVSICLRGFFPQARHSRDLLLSATKNRRMFSKIVAENEVKQCVGLKHTREREGHASEWPSVTKLTNEGGGVNVVKF